MCMSQSPNLLEGEGSILSNFMQNDCISLNDGFLSPLHKEAFTLCSSSPFSDTVQTSERGTWYWGVGASP